MYAHPAVRAVRNEVVLPNGALIQRLNRPVASSWAASALINAALSGPNAVRRAFLADIEVDVARVAIDEGAAREIVMQRARPSGHASGSCRIGAADDPNAVVDPRCRVIGVEGLRVADGSVMPTISSGNTNLPITRAPPKRRASGGGEWLTVRTVYNTNYALGSAREADRAMAGLHPIETASRDEIAALQLTRLKASLDACKNVPHYRAAFDAKGVTLGDLNSLTDLPHFPFTTKEDLRQNYPFGLFATPREQLVRIHASSGTTGKPTVVGFTKHDIDIWADVVARSIYAAGGRAGGIVHVAYGYGLFTGGLGAHYSAERLGCTVVPMSGGQSAKQIQLIQDFQPRVIMVTPSYMLALADEFVRQGIDPRETSLKIGSTVKVESAPNATDTRREAGGDLMARIKDAVGVTANIDVVEPMAIERSQGKARRVFDHRPR